MGCLYGTQPVEKCKCKCGGSVMHGLLVQREVKLECSPAVAVRCKSGLEGGECRCACKSQNHGLYHNIEGFENVKITGYQLM